MIQSTIPETSTCSSLEVHPNIRSQFFSSSVSAPSAPAAPESFDATQVILSFDNLRGTISGASA